MPDPVVLAIAAAVAAKGTEAIADGGRTAVAALVRLVRGRLRPADPHAAADAADAGADDDLVPVVGEGPDDPVRRERLAAALSRAIAEDPDFRVRLFGAWTAAAAELGVLNRPSGDITNQFSGTVTGGVIQARDIHGGVNFSWPAR